MEMTSRPPVALAVDIGAGSGRVIAGILENGTLRLEEVHRFTNEGVHLIDTWHWQVTRQFADVLEGLKKAHDQYGDAIQSIGVDTWGVDYGLIDEKGRLLGIPVQYRDGRTDGIMERAFAKVPAKTLYQATGNQFMFYNTLFQLMAEGEQFPERLKKADQLLFMPDLLNYWLCGTKANEATIASTGQLVDASTGEWASGILQDLEIPESILGPLVQPGDVLGDLLPGVKEATGFGDAKVIAVGSHDTASAYAAVPTEEPHAVYLSSGTWSLLGTMSDNAVVTDESFDLAFTNERATDGRIRLLKILCGMWILQECMSDWAETDGFDWDTLVAEAEAADPLVSFIDPDEERFATPGDMPERIRTFCRETGQPEPTSRGALARAVYESLALKYRLTTDQLGQLVGHELGTFHVVGGGSRNNLLNQFTANALNRSVVAGPVEATAAGNVLCQLESLGHVTGHEEMQQIITSSFEVDHFTPQDTDAWDQAFQRFTSLIKA